MWTKELHPPYLLLLLLLPLLAILTAACSKDMAVQDKLRFENHEMSLPVAGTVANQLLNGSGGVVTNPGKGGDEEAVSPDYAYLKRGQSRYDIHCAPCHDRAGQGHGVITLRGFPPSVALDDASVRELSDRELFYIISDGRRHMAGYRRLIPADDRWAIVAYLRALQLSRHMPAHHLELQDRRALITEANP